MSITLQDIKAASLPLMMNMGKLDCDIEKMYCESTDRSGDPTS